MDVPIVLLMKLPKRLTVKEYRRINFWVGNKPLSSCIACKKCAQTGRCTFNDRVNDFVEIALDYDGLVAAKQSNIELPHQEETCYTNFIH